MKHILEAIKKAKRVYLCGNGGSAANAIHIANDLVASGIRAHPLTADIATFSAIANDFGYEHVFSRQLSVYGEAGDVLLALSGSGTSRNILEAVKIADEIGMQHFLITDYLRTRDMQQSEEEQLSLGHYLMRELREKR